MSQMLYRWDVWLFHMLNGTWTNPFFDVAMPFVTDLNKQSWMLAFIAALIVWALWRGGTRGRQAVLVLTLTILIMDQFSSAVLKDLFLRPRPCHELTDVRLLVSCGAGKSFPSSHAVNTFAGAVVLGFFYPRAWWYLLGYGALVAYSRIYVGVHYPFDVIGGGIIGAAGAALILWVSGNVVRFIRRRQAAEPGRAA
ncbi:MAG: phosphatase PAP2 family protein [Bacteroidetes bacterium]|jgi:undecaprenyl-diphosphatase|nr:phosphatase PAP2 family protein [Bacteroidota bacterium]